MKAYPSISRATGMTFQEIPNAYVFDKLDGSNLRFEWTRKRKQWMKFGTRTRLFDASDWQFGRAIKIFAETLADPVAKIATDQRWESVIVFAEHWGPNSFAGCHHDAQNQPLDPDDQMRVDLIDVAPHKQGLLGPAEYLKLFEGLPIAKFLGRLNWTRGFVERVWSGDVEGITLEGVVGKAGHGKTHDLVMAKAKTKAWVDRVKARYAPDEAEKLISS
jgi:hypothetical protein